MRKISKKTWESCLCFGAMVLFGATSVIAAASADNLIGQVRSAQAAVTERHSYALAERIEQICTGLLEWNAASDRRTEIGYRIAGTAALASEDLTYLPLESVTEKSLRRYLARCGSSFAEDQSELLLRYGETVLMYLEDSLSEGTDIATLTVPLFFPDDGTAASVTAYDPETDVLSVSEAKKSALAYLGNTLSLKRIPMDPSRSYYRFGCRNGFCDIRKTDGALLRLAVYKAPLSQNATEGELQTAILDFCRRQGFGIPEPVQTCREDGIFLGTYQASGYRIHLGISESSARISSYRNMGKIGTDSRSHIPFPELPGQISAADGITGSDGSVIWEAAFDGGTDPLWGIAEFNPRTGALSRIRFFRRNDG